MIVMAGSGKEWRLRASLTLLMSLSVACSSTDESESTTPQMVAAFYPFAFVGERIAGDHAVVTNLTPPGVEPHDLELTPGQVVKISDADIAIYEAGFQPSVDDAIEQNPPDSTLEVTEVVSLLEEPPSAESHPDEHAEDDSGEFSSGDSADAPLQGDPHLWQDPTLLIPVAEVLADELASADPDHASDFKANAAALVKDLRELDSDFQTGLASCERREIVTSHAAFGYLANRYDLTMIAIAGLSPEIEPSPERLAEIQDLVQSSGITTVFSETLGSKQYADTLATDLGVTAAVLDPIEGLADEDSDEDYLSLMRSNLEVLREANGCT